MLTRFAPLLILGVLFMGVVAVGITYRDVFFELADTWWQSFNTSHQHAVQLNQKSKAAKPSTKDQQNSQTQPAPSSTPASKPKSTATAPPTTQPSTPPPPAAPAPCEATTMASLNDCIANAKQGKTDAIEITGMIPCSTQNACAVNLSNIKRDGATQLHVYGSANTTSGLNKTDTSVYILINLSGSSNILLSNLTLNQHTSPQNDASCAGGTASACATSVYVYQADNLTFDKLDLEDADFGYSMSNSTNITIKNTTIHNSYEFGIWLGSGSSGINILGDTIKDTGSNGILFAGGSNILVQNTLFQHNHHNSIFWSCGTGNQPCSGGQIYASNVSNLTFDADTITGGIMDDAYNGQTYEQANLHASGIELSSNINGMTVKHSDINTNTGAGIVANASLANLASIVITNNRMYANLNPVVSPSTQLGPNYDISWANNSVAVVSVANNCYTQGCAIP